MSAETFYGGGSSFQRPGDADVLTKRRQSTGKEVHYFIGPIRETLEEAEADRKRWERGGADVSHLPRSVGECATWIETAARQASLLEKQAEEIAASKLREEDLRERVKAMRADAERKRTEAGRQELPINMHRQSGREEAFGEVLVLLAET